MFGVLAVFLIYLLQCSGWKYCSDTKFPAPCTPCRNDGTDRYKCPRQCGAGRNINLCDQVCSQHCRDSECEYDDGQVSLRCVKGCTGDVRAGPACTTLCKDGCDTCDQQSGQCTKCAEGRYGVDCAKTCRNCKSTSCDQSNGTCLLGCSDQFYGPKCTGTCPEKCMRCTRDTGSCVQCEAGWEGADCSRNILTPAVTPKQQQGDKPTEDVTTKSGLKSMFEDQDYLLPVVGCALVLLIVVAVVIFWRCKRKSKSKTRLNEEEGKCDGASQHASVRRLFNSDVSDSHYDEIIDDMDGMKKRLLEDRALLTVPTPENKPLACLRNRSGNLSTPYMSPIVEAVEEEEEEEPVTTPNVIFTVEPPSDEETTGRRDSLASDDPGSHDDGPEVVKTNGSLVSDTETGDDAAGMPERQVDLLNVPGRGMFIFQNGSNVENGSYGDYADSCNSGFSTPKVPDMYLHNAPDSNNELATNIADHLDKYLSQRQTAKTDPENEYMTPLHNGASSSVVSESPVFPVTDTAQQSEKNSKDKLKLNLEEVPQNEHMTVHNGTSDTGVSDSGVLISTNTEELNEKNNNDKRRFKSKLPLPKSKTKYNHKSYVPKSDTRLTIDASEKESMLNHRDTIDC